MRISLFLPHVSITGGLGVHARSLLTALLRTAGADDAITILIPRDPQKLFPQSGLDHSWEPLASQLSIVPLDWPADHPLALPLDRVLLEPVAAARPDVFYSSYYTGLEAPPCPQAVTFHDAGFLDFPEIFGDTAHQRRQTLQRIGSRIASLVCVSNDARERIARLLPFDLARMDVVHHALADTPSELAAAQDESKRHEPLWPNGDRLTDWGPYLFSPVGAATGFNRVRKNLPNAILAFRSLPHRTVRFIIASTGILHEKMLRELLPTHELTAGTIVNGAWRSADDAIRILPNLDRAQFLTAMAHATAMVYPSRYEGFGLPTIEAMALGVPVIASHATSIPEVVGDAGKLIAPDDVMGFQHAMQTLIDSPSERKMLIDRGRVRAPQFTLDAMGGAMWNVFRRIAAR